MYRLIALDLDDTLLGSDGIIGPAHLEAVQGARARGCGITLVTARSWRATRGFAEQLGLTAPVICLTGAACYNMQGEPVRVTPLDLAEARQLAAEADRQQWAIRVYFADGRILHSRPADDYVSRLGAVYPADAYAGDVLPLLAGDEPPLQVVLLGHRSVEGALACLPELPGLTATTYERGTPTSRTHLFRAGVSKGAALEQYCSQRAIPREAVIAMGDGLPDLSMIQWAGAGVAMGWAPEEVRRAADLVIPADDPAPVATALRLLLGGAQP